MLIITREQTYPYFNIAAEEYMLKHMKEDCFALWRNEPAIIVGKHQNTLAEINSDFVNERQIPVIRRLSGGGAVFHDLGNICFTFVKNKKEGELTDFSTFTKPIINLLQKLGVEAEFSGRNDLTINGLKFSGNAEATWKNRVLHHGTLLFSSSISDLSPALNVHPDKFQDKAVKSVRSRITNISEHLKEPMGVMDFSKLIEEQVLSEFPGANRVHLSNKDIADINTLAKEKYETWGWNFGRSPNYNLTKRLRTQNGGVVETFIFVDKGIITGIRFFGDYFGAKDSEELVQKLLHTPHETSSIQAILNTIHINDYFKNVTFEELMSVLI